MEKQFSSQEEAKKEKLRLFEKYFPEDGLGKRPFSALIHRKTVAEVYDVLSNIENVPDFFENLQKIQMRAPDQADWIFNDSGVEGPESIPMKLEREDLSSSLVWRSETSAGFDYSVTIFLEPAPAGRGTVVRMLVAYNNLGGAALGRLEALLGKDAMINSKKNLYRLKAFLETGHVPTTEGQSSGRDAEESSTTKH